MNNKNNKQAKQELLKYLDKFYFVELTWTQANNLVDDIIELIEERIKLLNYYY